MQKPNQTVNWVKLVNYSKRVQYTVSSNVMLNCFIILDDFKKLSLFLHAQNNYPLKCFFFRQENIINGRNTLSQ